MNRGFFGRCGRGRGGRRGQPISGICMVCGKVIPKRRCVPLRFERCPDCGTFTIVRNS